jgi:V8-like Glu-specific endopeptidase
MIDTSGGQSGSPILIKEKTDKYSAIGIHKGYAGNNYNIGFLLKSEAMLWIY